MMSPIGVLVKESRSVVLNLWVDRFRSGRDEDRVFEFKGSFGRYFGLRKGAFGGNLIDQNKTAPTEDHNNPGVPAQALGHWMGVL
jgi:hypothetical protein